MDIGFLTIATAQSGDLAALARRAEEIGFDSLWIPEHPIIPRCEITGYPLGGELPEHYGRWTDPFISLMLAGAVTSKIKLATGICLLPEREPLVTAKVIASLDYYSKGRVILGIGAGWLRQETEIMGAEFRTRWGRMREMKEAMQALWTQESATYAGKFYNFPAVRSEPKPVQAGGPPFVLGGHSEKSLLRIAKHYDGWCPLISDPDAFGKGVATLREMARAEGRNPDSLQMTPFVDPDNGKITDAMLREFRKAGANRLVMFYSQQTHELADGAGPLMERVANVVERAKGL